MMLSSISSTRFCLSNGCSHLDRSSFRLLVCQGCITVKVRCELPKDRAANALEIEVPLPKSVERTNCEGSRDQTWDWKEKTRTIVWRFKSMKGGDEAVLSIRATLDKVSAQ